MAAHLQRNVIVLSEDVLSTHDVKMLALDTNKVWISPGWGGGENTGPT